MSYHPCFERRDLMRRLEPGLRATAERHRAGVEEVSGGPLIYLDLGAGRDVALPASFCALCWGAGRVLEPGPLGLMAVLCPTCEGRRTV